ncbi:MAG: TrkH family potassium uptake protein [SAR324 cluster bacterium]|nr:TrkH family potassium uptake protein [SAR324 cluster bacterium]
MQFFSILKIIGFIILVVGLGQLIPIGVSMANGQTDLHSLIVSFSIAVIVGLSLLVLPKSNRQFKNKDGFALVGFGWLLAGFFGALPYYISGAIPSFTDAYFESVSGFTTTGSSILTNIEGLSPELLLWRSLTQWFGGMGIIVLTLAIIPYLKIGGMSIFQAEVPGPSAEKLTPRIQDTAKVLWFIYFIFTVVLTILLHVTGFSWLDAVNHSFTTMSTGGFSTNNGSLGGFNNPAAEWLITFFMTIAGINFALHYRYLFRKAGIRSYFIDSECQFYLGMIALSIVTIFAVIAFSHEIHDMDTFRGVAFTVVSIVTTTGFGTADYELWPMYGQFLLLLLMIAGGSAGSTAGGVKTVRIMLILKYMYAEMQKLIHPNLVKTIKIQQVQVEPPLLASILSFVFIYLTVMIFSIMLVSFEVDDLLTAISSVIACLGNIGPGLGSVGPTENFAHLGDFTKWVLSLNMVMGRLEILTILLLFLPQTWKKG